MYLIVSSTAMELNPVEFPGKAPELFGLLLIGVGPVEAAVNLTEYLCRSGPERVTAVINVGLAGAYPGAGVQLLDICLAEQEYFGDIGIRLDGRIDDLDHSLAPPLEFKLSPGLLDGACDTLVNAGFAYRRGNFVTVSGASGTTGQGGYLRDKFKAICENMEGAAVARVCQKFSLPCLELRCVSNMVVDRDDQAWRTVEAVEICGRAVRAVMEGLQVG
ncbi:MAG: futalosine hydrolase [Desulfurivibrionaceae bacterium]|nr:futalosine hydrolase [Desulfurivibrionaceae bacterium]